MLPNELKLIFLILLIQNLKALQFIPFECFEKEAKQLEEETPMRLVINNETIYLLYGDRIFKFDVPFVFQEYVDYGKKGENYTAITIKPAFVSFIKQFSAAETVLNLVKYIYGYAHDTRSNKKISYVIYSDRENTNISDFQLRRLKFNDFPGELDESKHELESELFTNAEGKVEIIFIHIDDKKFFRSPIPKLINSIFVVFIFCILIHFLNLKE